MTDRRTASTITDTELDQLYDALDTLRAVARGYCEHCGRGDATPPPEAYEEQRARAARAADLVARVRAVRDRWLLNTLQPGQIRRLLDDLTTALDQTAPAVATRAPEPREHCGHLSPETGFSTVRTECVLRPGHSGSHADDVGCRWWPIDQEQSDA
ncbi:hypothetical protein ACFY9A_28895 [Streptomyces rubradiris]|uniref:hypothetical protein n=1 Tax=Streptomyces rubradiris TaxID=285531 RepID=UPI0036E9AD8B